VGTGTGGVGGLGGAGGAGGGGSATCSDSIMNGDETGVDCGGSLCPACPFALLLATGSVNATAGHLDGQTGSWSSITLNGISVDEPALAISDGQGIGLMRFTQLGNAADNQLQYMSYANGIWMNFAPVAAGVTTQGPPSIAASATGFQAAFHGFDFNNYFAGFTGGAWAPTAEAIGSASPHAGDITSNAAGSTFVFARGPQNDLVARDRTAGVWLPEQLIAPSAQVNFNIPPEVVTTTGTDLMVAFVAPGGQIRFATRTASIWSATAAVPFATTADRVALTALPGGNAVLAFRGMDGNLYASVYTGGAWFAPGQVTTGILSAPSITQGIGPAAVELAYIGNDGNAYHRRFITNAWTAPTLVGGPNLVGVAIASSP
jgi:hypothetical protein